MSRADLAEPDNEAKNQKRTGLRLERRAMISSPPFRKTGWQGLRPEQDDPERLHRAVPQGPGLIKIAKALTPLWLLPPRHGPLAAAVEPCLWDECPRQTLRSFFD